MFGEVVAGTDLEVEGARAYVAEHSMNECHDPRFLRRWNHDMVPGWSIDGFVRARELSAPQETILEQEALSQGGESSADGEGATSVVGDA